MKPTTGQTCGLVTTDSSTSPPSTTGMPKKMSVTRESARVRQPAEEAGESAEDRAEDGDTEAWRSTPTTTEVRAP